MKSLARLNKASVCAAIAILLVGCYNLDVKNADGGDQPSAIDGAGETGVADASQPSDTGLSGAADMSGAADTLGAVDMPGAADIPLPDPKLDASLVLDANMPESSSDVQPTPDVSADVPLDAPADHAPHCGGCCSNTDCPLTAPVCGSDNQCTKCTGDQDCDGRSSTACNVTSGACVQCMKSSQCGAPAVCDTSNNRCVGCTQRSDCPGACQTCTNGSCVPVKDADDPARCAGTCDGNGECKSKQGQSCDIATTAGCIAGTTCSLSKICAITTACTGAVNGTPCGSGKVCNSEICQDGCWIDGAFVASGASNTNNTCQICTPSKSTTSWSNDDSKTAVPCGSCNGTAACVGGALGPCSATVHTYYPDGDGDGYGVSTNTVTACNKPTGYVANGGDCCDSDANAFPGQTKTFSTKDNCGSFDYNCDGQETPKSNGPTNCGTPNCVWNTAAQTCVDDGGCTCNGDCTTYTTSSSCGGQVFVTTGAFCLGTGASCNPMPGHTNAAGFQECN